jgi:hypothetical protein
MSHRSPGSSPCYFLSFYLLGRVSGRSGRGEIRTHDTEVIGMPVFETGAFNHSATRPTIYSVLL